jgi:hypothetical protein
LGIEKERRIMGSRPSAKNLVGRRFLFISSPPVYPFRHIHSTIKINFIRVFLLLMAIAASPPPIFVIASPSQWHFRLKKNIHFGDGQKKIRGRKKSIINM